MRRPLRASAAKRVVVALAVGAAALAGGSIAGAATGALTYKGCISGETQTGPTGSDACEQTSTSQEDGEGSGLDDLTAAVMSGDGKWLYATSSDDDAVARFERRRANGALSFRSCYSGNTDVGPSGTGACDLVPTAEAGTLGDATGLSEPKSMAISPDGRWLYTASIDDDAVARFKRNRTTGVLHFKGCTTGETETGPGGSGACKQIPHAQSNGENSGLDSLQAVAISGDGRSLYVTSNDDDAVTRFKRDLETGVLRFRGCITGERQSGPAGTGACKKVPSTRQDGEGSGLDELESLALSRNGKSLYVSANGSTAVARFNRSRRTGALKYKGCITAETESGPAGSGACKRAANARPDGESSGLHDLSSITLSADGRSLYATGSDDAGLARFARNRRTGALRFKGCLTGDADAGPTGTGECKTIPTVTPGPYGENSGMDDPQWADVSRDGKSLYVASAGDAAVVRFKRNRRTGALRFRDCITGDTDAGPTGTDACAATTVTGGGGEDSGLDSLDAVLASGDGKSVYTVSDNDTAVARFKRARR